MIEIHVVLFGLWSFSLFRAHQVERFFRRLAKLDFDTSIKSIDLYNQHKTNTLLSFNCWEKHSYPEMLLKVWVDLNDLYEKEKIAAQRAIDEILIKEE